jgi:hypothetical protein
MESRLGTEECAEIAVIGAAGRVADGTRNEQPRIGQSVAGRRRAEKSNK